MAWSLPKTDGGAWGMGGLYGTLYNPATEENVYGYITAIENFFPTKAVSPGTCIMIQTGEKIVQVHLGPSWYLGTLKLNLAVGDQVEAIGSRVTHDAKSVIMARQIKLNSDIFTLRDEKGLPVWRNLPRRYPE